MALNQKNSRPITIDGEKFRWLVSPVKDHIVFVAEKEGIKGRKIEIHIDSEINEFWLRFPNVEGMNLKVIKPKDASFLIESALELGWNPEEKGSPLVFEWRDKNLVEKNLR